MRSPLNWDSRTIAILVLAVSLSTVALLVSADGAQAHTLGCTDDDRGDAPLWITKVNPFEVNPDNDDGTVITQDAAVFANTSDQLRFELDILNRLPTSCEGDQDGAAEAWTNQLRISVNYLYGTGQTGWTEPEALSCTGTTSSNEIDAQELCEQVQVDLPTAVQGQAGEQRVRFVVFDLDADDDGDGLPEDCLPSDHHDVNNDGENEGACAGAERVIVVEQKPDLEPGGIHWVEPTNPDKHQVAATHTGDTTTFSVDIFNNGTYPNWNPNGNRDINTFWGRSAFDANTDSDLAPDDDGTNENQYHAEQDNDADPPPCRWTGTTLGGTVYPCSYRRGARLQVPYGHELFERDEEFENDDEEDEKLVETGSHQVYSPNSQDQLAYDKNHRTVIKHAGNAAGDNNFRASDFNAVDRFRRAGYLNLSVQVDHDPNTGQDNVPELLNYHDFENDDDVDTLTEHNNDLGNRTINLTGPDLAITDPRVRIESPDGVRDYGDSLLCPKANRCNVSSTIKLDTYFKNIGANVSEYFDSSAAHDHEWQATVYLNGEIALKANRNEQNAGPDDYANVTFDEVPIPDNGKQAIFAQDTSDSFLDAVEIDPLAGGGKQVLQIRLDHEDNYKDRPSPPEDERGFVGERQENQSYPCGATDVEEEKLDNTFCVTLWFQNKNPPTVSNLQLDSEEDDSDQAITEFTEGTNVTFNATVEDTNVENVTAVFEHANGSAAQFENEDGTFSELEMTHQPTDLNPDRYAVTETIQGDVGEFTLRVVASDGKFESEATQNFNVNELAKTVEVKNFEVNGQTTILGPDAPRYQGTADDPDNWFNITASVNNTGLREDSPEGKTVVVFRPNGTKVAELPTNNRTACRVETLDGVQTQYGSDCEGGDVRHEWTQFWADSRRPNSDAEPVDLDWVGTFGVEYTVTDKFDREKAVPQNATIKDRLNDNGEGAPILEDASFTNGTLSPGDTISAEGTARDVLRVESVYLNMTKPDGTQAKAELTLKQVENATTRNGTYRATFETGQGADVFDQGGDYRNVQLVAEDFAGNTTSTATDTIKIQDGGAPTIETFFTEPRDAIEIGGNLTWKARITDDTAIKPPTLHVTSRGQLGSLEPIEMVKNETTERWVTPEPVTVQQTGTWRYNIQVADYAGNQVEAQGTIEVKQNLGPQTQNWEPTALGTQETAFGPPNPTISFELVDPGKGVDSRTIEVSVNGEDVSSQVQRTEIPSTCAKCYKIKYTPEQDFSDGDTVEVTVKADDLSSPPESSTNVGNYTVDAVAPTPSFTMSPSVVQGDRQIIGLPTTINVSASDTGSGADRAKVTATFIGQAGSSPSQSLTFEGAEGSFQLPDLADAFKGHGVYELALTARDEVGNKADKTTRRVLYDKAGPSVEVFGQPGQPREFVFANVTDDAPIRSVEATYNVNGGPDQTLPLEKNNGSWSVRLFNQRTGEPFKENSTVRFTVEAVDRFGNSGASTQKTFTAGDSVPTVDITAPSRGDEISGTTEIAWEANDVETPSNQLRISLFFKKPGGSFKEIPQAQDLDNAGSYSLDSTLLPNGEVVLQVIVFDGTNFGADTVKVQARNLGEAFNSPQIQAAQISGGSPVVQPSQDTTFRVQIDGNVKRAWANITRNGSLVKSVELERGEGKTWQGDFTTPSRPGNYSVTLSAITDEGEKKAIDAYGFKVQGEPADGGSFIPEWTLLTVLTGGAVAVGVLGLKREWT